MNLSFSEFALDDLVIDPEAVEQAINNACRKRRPHKQVQAVCQIDNRVFFVLRHVDEHGPGCRYRLVPLADPTPDGFVAAVADRYQGSTDIVGTVTAGDAILALFAKLDTPGAGQA